MTTTQLTHTARIPALPAGLPSYAAGAGDHPLLGETIGANFDRIAALHGDRQALVDRASGRRWTYADLHADVIALAHGLLRLGIEKGDRVGIWAPNCRRTAGMSSATFSHRPASGCWWPCRRSSRPTTPG